MVTLSRAHSHTPLARTVLVAALFALIQPVTFAQVDSSVVPEYLLDVLTRDEGLPHNTVSSIAQTPDGYLWIGTHEGLARFDGVRFTTYTAAETPGLDSDQVVALSSDKSGSLWIGLERAGVARWHGGVFTSLAPLSAQTNQISMLAANPDGSIWAGLSRSRIMRWRDGQWRVFSARDHFPARFKVTCSAGGDGRTWFASENSFGFFEGDVCTAVQSERDEFYHLTASREGGVWLAREHRLQYLDNDLNSTLVGSLAPLAHSSGIQTLYEDRSGVLWVGTKGNGLYRFANGRLVQVPTSHEFILAIHEDREGNLWVGTWGGGLNRIRPRIQRVYDTSDGLPKSLVTSLAEDGEGALWIASRWAEPASLPPGRDTALRHGKPRHNALVNIVCADRSGGMWMAAEENGLFHWKDGSYRLVGFRGTWINSLFQDSKTNLWIGTRQGGLIRWGDGREERVRLDGDSAEITMITEDPVGTLWVGTHQGTLYRRSRNADSFTRIEVAPESPRRPIQVIHADGPDQLWIGTKGGGLTRLTGERTVTLTTERGLPDNDIRQILPDDLGYLWLGSSRGLFRANTNALNAAVDDRTRVVECLSVGRSYGLGNFEFQSGFRNAMCKTADGHLWFSTTRGAVEIDPSKIAPEQGLPQVHIEQLLVDGQPVSLSGGHGVSLPPGSGRVEIRYTTTSFTAPENVRFRHRLNSLDPEWVKAGVERSVTYFRIPPGEHQFHVMARGSAGRWNRTGASLSFDVQPTLWQSTWFRTTFVLCTLLCFAFAVRFVVLRKAQRRLQALEQAQALERERRRIARDMHDDLGASLTQLALLSAQTRRAPQLDEQTASRMNRISSIAKDVALSLDQIVWTVNPRNDGLDRVMDYLSQYTLDYLKPTEIALTLDLPEGDGDRKLNSHVRHEMFLTFKEALNNAVKHARASRLTLHMRVERDDLVIQLADDGIGFSDEECADKGEGLRSLRQRLAAVSGSCRVDSSPGRGTTVTLTVPLITEKAP